MIWGTIEGEWICLISRIIGKIIHHETSPLPSRIITHHSPHRPIYATRALYPFRTPSNGTNSIPFLTFKSSILIAR
uniref:Uncharacterized protein n=1 Tax=Picea glauca TaxID=3330 RepID=A0A117NHH6_PICGL|nr:hypothetical protein ABT39_MTgene5408 [Picea glauca]QHR90606.1 hypothetical protein Q903MT_gene4631 [Picea sitchensis]